ncbi:MAG: glutaredoxin [Verrucomicrobia bacterium]|nr:glutaredoxin [Verrucomicrobiota bacterium]
MSAHKRCIRNEKPVLVLYYSPYCGFSQKVLNYLRQIHKTVPMKNVINNPEAKEELRKYGGIMQVPCLFIDGKPLYDSDQIIQWLSQHQEDLDPA